METKLILDLFFPPDPPAFYPTYEEWKLLNTTIKKTAVEPFYPTYEEWRGWRGMEGGGEEWRGWRGMKTILSLSFQVMLPSF